MLLFKAAHNEVPQNSLIDEIDSILGMTDEMPLLHYQDVKRGISKRILVDTLGSVKQTKQVVGVRLVGETLATEWLKEVLS